MSRDLFDSKTKRSWRLCEAGLGALAHSESGATPDPRRKFESGLCTTDAPDSAISFISSSSSPVPDSRGRQRGWLPLRQAYHRSCGCSSATEVRVRVRHYGAGSVKAYTRSERTRFPAPDTTASTRARNRDQSALFWSNSVYTHRINGTIMCSLLHHNRSKPPKGLKVSPARSRWSVGTSPLSP